MWLRRALAIAVGFAGLVLGVLVLALAPGAPDDRLPAGGVPAVALVVAIGWSFVGVGSFAMLRRPDARTGALLAAFGLAALTASLTVSDSPALYLLAMATDSVAIAVFVHLLLSFPDGRLEDRPARLTVAAGYVLAAGLPVAAILLGGDPAEYDCAGCPENPVAIADRPGLAEALSSTVTVGVLALALAVAVIALMSRRWRRASSYQRRALGPPLAAGLAILGLALVWIAVQAIGVGDRAERVAQLVYLSTFAALPLAFLAGLVRVRFFRTAAVGRLLERLADEPGAGRLDDALAEALGDPSLRIAYWLPEPRVTSTATVARSRRHPRELPRSRIAGTASGRSCTAPTCARSPNWSGRSCGPPRWLSRTHASRPSCEPSSRRSVPRVPGSSRPPTRSAGASAATCTMARSSGWSRSCSP